ncbi:MAG: glutamine synthetase [Gammaproteobacteria bacterium]|nr:MAG: glutamine synthetase [Gammaproteobacteria bacterium]
MYYFETHGIENVKLAVTDIDGIMRGKYVSLEKFASIADKGFGFCDVVFGWDSDDVLYGEDSFTGWQHAFPDAWAHIDLSSGRLLPTEDRRSVIFLADFDQHRASEVCPRSILKRVLKRLKSHGMTATVAAEFEFFLFNETPQSIRDKQFRDLQPMTPGNFGYSLLRASTHSDFYHDLLELCEQMAMPIEGLHTETGPGVLEVAMKYDNALRAADNAVLFKTFCKVLAQKKGLMATFMAKWSNQVPGQSGHLHMALQDREGRPIFHDADKPDTLSDTMRYFIGGQQRLMPELLAMVASTCNSYTRLIPGFWAPTAASWGVDNRTCALRAIPGSPYAQRVEYRVAAADINPYLAIAAALGSGLWGIENRIEPSEPIVGNAYEPEYPDELQLPRTLSEAAERLAQSEAAKDLFGDSFVSHFAYTRQWEDVQQRQAITDWQLQRYFEII